jgi:HEAT repeat-containing protein 5
MQREDPYVLSAIEGREPSLDSPDASQSKSRDDPAAFFFILFGLAYEALATSSAESAPGALQVSHQSSTIALQALRYLVRPEYCGSSFLQTPAFQELVSLCYRIAMTEPPVVQVSLVEMVAELASSHKSQLPRSV